MEREGGATRMAFPTLGMAPIVLRTLRSGAICQPTAWAALDGVWVEALGEASAAGEAEEAADGSV